MMTQEERDAELAKVDEVTKDITFVYNAFHGKTKVRENMSNLE